jgi:hypothetical protein
MTRSVEEISADFLNIKEKLGPGITAEIAEIIQPVKTSASQHSGSGLWKSVEV